MYAITKKNMGDMVTEFKNITKSICSSYAAILFTADSRIGLVFLLVTFWYPNIGTVGLVSALIAVATERLFKFRNLGGDLHIYNSLLVGLGLGATYQLNGNLLLLVFLASVSSVFFSVVLSEWLWRIEKLPALSLPFVLIAFICTFAAQGYVKLNYYVHPVPSYEVFLNVPIDYFLTALGATFITPVPMAGLLLFLGIFITSRYLALLAVSGFVAGNTVYGLLSGVWYSAFSVGIGFNFILTAIAVGGIFAIPGIQSFIFAMLGSALAAMIASTMQSLLLPYGVPMMAVPFLLSTLMLLTVLNKRTVNIAPYLLLENPSLPEVSLERVRLAKVRGFGNSALTLYTPFVGEWTVYQGMDGEHTHKAPWQYALDFIMTDENGKSYRTSGEFLTDYYCFGLPILSPVYGQVSSCMDYLPDHVIGEVDTENNWGNFVLIWIDDQHSVLLAHLQQSSLQVKVGDWVYIGQKIAQCGNTGRSPQPHIHLHVQQNIYLGSPTVNFTLGNVVIRRAEKRQFHLIAQPQKNDLVSSQPSDGKLAQALYLPIGKQLSYQFRKNATEWQIHSFTVILTLAGQFRLHADSGASVAFATTNNILAFYDRNDVKDACLDLLLLNVGLTPLVSGLLHWEDQPTASLLALPKLQKWLYHLLPFGHRLQCNYQRQWDIESETWIQESVQEYRCYWHKKQNFHTKSTISPELGCVKMKLTLHGETFEALLQGHGRANDVGVIGTAMTNQ